MRSPLLSAVLLLAGLGATKLAAAQAEMPTAVTTKVVQNQWMVRATVNNHEGWFLLSTSTKDSILLPRTGDSGPSGRTQRYNVTLGTSGASDVSFKVLTSPALQKLDVAGVLGMNALANFNIGLDIESARAFVWHDQPSLFIERGWVLLLPMIASSTQHATTLSIEGDSIPSGIKGAVGLAPGLSVVSTGDMLGSISGSALGQASSLTLEDSGGVVVDEVALGDITPFWTMGSKADHLPAKQIATLPITSLPVRRMVLDGHTGTIVTEILGETGADSILLGHLMGLPLDIENNTLYVRQMPDGTTLYGTDFRAYGGNLIVSLAGIPAIDIVAALQGSTAQRLAMLKRLAHARVQGYGLDMLVGENEKSVNIKPVSGLSSK